MKQQIYKYGIELECYIDSTKHEEFVAFARKYGYEVGWDCTIKATGYSKSGMEIKCNGAKTYTQLDRSLAKLGTKLKKYDVQANKSCGYHLHMSNKRFFNKLNIERIVKTWLAVEDILYATQPAERQNSTYCKRKLYEYASVNHVKLPQGKSRLVNELARYDRYYSLNLASLYKHGTIEIRLHQGTTDKEQVIQWVKLMRHIFDYALDKGYDSKKVDELFKEEISDAKIQHAWELLGLPEPLANYFTKRIRKQLFARLVDQQKAAWELLKTKTKAEKLKKAQDKIVAQRRELENQTAQYRRVLSPTSY